MSRVILIVLDSLGVGAAPDASRFGDESADTLGNISKWCETNFKTFALPNLAAWGLGNLYSDPLFGVPAEANPKSAYGKMVELSPGKDTTTGHWELAGNILKKEFPVFENGFDESLLKAWVKENNLSGWLGNKPASGTTILEELGEEHLATQKPIVYTSGDSVFQIACSEEIFGLEKLYQISKSARRFVDPLGVGRVIARPFIGSKKGTFKRTENRRDFSVPPPEPNLLDLLRSNDAFVGGVGKIEDIFAHRSVNLVDHTGNNEKSLRATLKMMDQTKGQNGLIFTNLIDFDQLHGHRRNVKTYAEALMEFDKWLPSLEAKCETDDWVLLTADHGNDPTHRGSDHTREIVPLLIWSKRSAFNVLPLGTLAGFTHVARFVLEALGLSSSSLAKLPDAMGSKSVYQMVGS